MVAHRGDHFLLVVNASRKAADEAHLRAALDACTVETLEDRALLALQGPAAEAVLAPLAPGASAMRFMDVRALRVAGVPCVVARSGYTGEDGFEIGLAADRAEELARALLDDPAVAPIGLGARDSLRLEAGLCLYGSDLDAATTPVAAALEWSIPRSRRTGGARAGGFPGADIILRELASGAAQRRVGLMPEGRAPIRHGVALFAADAGGEPIGQVTSGGFGPSVDAPIAMGYVPRRHSQAGARLFAELRGKRLPVRVTDLPFVKHGYKRG
jgi:aminomethyltransferase